MSIWKTSRPKIGPQVGLTTTYETDMAPYFVKGSAEIKPAL